MYTEEEFVSFYGEDKGLVMWKKAGDQEPGTAPAPTPSEFKRAAPNGYMYTLDEFVSFYGDSKGRAMWESASAEEPVAGTRAGDQDPGTASVPASSNEPSKGRAKWKSAGAEEPITGTRAGDQDPGTAAVPASSNEPTAGTHVRAGELGPVLVSPNDIQRLRTEGKRIHRNFETVHNAARAELIRWIDIGVGAGEPGPVDFPWQHYVAMHPQAAELVGPGITALVPAFIAGTSDPNRSGDPPPGPREAPGTH